MLYKQNHWERNVSWFKTLMKLYFDISGNGGVIWWHLSLYGVKKHPKKPCCCYPGVYSQTINLILSPVFHIYYIDLLQSDFSVIVRCLVLKFNNQPSMSILLYLFYVMYIQTIITQLYGQWVTSLWLLSLLCCILYTGTKKKSTEETY